MNRFDLKIVEYDVKFNQVKSPEQISNRDVIAQDIVHRLYESKLLREFIGLRNDSIINLLKTKIELEVSKDDRLKPSSIQTQYNHGQLIVYAITRDYGPITLSANYD